MFFPLVLNIYYWSIECRTFYAKKNYYYSKIIYCLSISNNYIVSPIINIIIEIAGLISTGIGIIRLDRKKKKKFKRNNNIEVNLYAEYRVCLQISME